MALLWFEGFDDFLPTTSGQAQNYLTAKGWASVTGTWPVGGDTPLTRFVSGYCMKVPGSGANYEYGKLLSASQVVTEGIFGAAFDCTTDNIGTGMRFSFRNYGASTYIHFQVQLNATQVFIQYGFTAGMGAGTFQEINTPNLTWFTDTWNFIEIKFKVDAAAGYVQVRINGAPVASISGVQTQNSLSVTNCNSIFFGNTSYADSYIDDLYLVDLTGTVNNSWLGEVRTFALVPNAAGDLTQWTPTGAATNWQAAANQDPSTTTIYNATTTVNNEDLYNLTDLSSSATIYGVLVSGSYLHDDASFHSAANIIKTHATVYQGATLVTASMSYLASQDLYQVNPNTGVGWTQAEVNALQVGPKMVS